MNPALQSNINYHERLERNGDEPEVNPIMRDLARHTWLRLEASKQRDQQNNEAQTSGDKEGEQSTPNNQS